jgi:hypothetical protein
MAENDWQLPWLDLPVAKMQIRPADRARPDPQQQLSGSRLGVGERGGPERAARLLEEHRAHRSMMTVPRTAGGGERRRYSGAMESEEQQERPPEDQPDEPGAEGGTESPAADAPPAAPSDDDAPLGDSDQHSTG